MTAARRAARAGIDWDAVRRRLADAERVLAQQAAPSPGERQAILRARALALAAEAKAATGESCEVLDFVLAQERYAIETTWVREVVPLRELAALPGVPPFVLGIMPLRGEIVSVLDLKKFFELPDRGLSDLNKAIVLTDGAMQFAILADLVAGVRRLPLAELQPPLATLTDIRSQYLLGITGRRDVVLDGRRLLCDPAIVVAEEAAG